MFARQDQVQGENWRQAPAEFALIERGLTLGFDLTVWLVERHKQIARDAGSDADLEPPPDVLRPAVIRANLLHAAFVTLVSATRLVLFGDVIDALALTRTAFEAVFHAEYFRDHPAALREWDQIGSVLDVLEVQRRVGDFNGKHDGVRKRVRARYTGEAGESFDRVFAELSTFGTHINPKTVGLRLGTSRPQAANLGFLSVGYSERPLLCASLVLGILRYALSEFRDGFGAELAHAPALGALLTRFEADEAAYRVTTGSRCLSLLL